MAKEPIIPHDGGTYPGDEMDAIRPIYRGPQTIPDGVRITFAPARRLDWSHSGSDDDIVAYQVVSGLRC